MPIPELQDYINIINSEKEKEETEWKISEQEEKQNSSFSDVFGNIKNPLM